jgi:hypothetical protein
MNLRAVATIFALITPAYLSAGCVPIGGCGDGNPEPFVGTWELHRTLDFSDPCPSFSIPATANVGITRDQLDGFLIDNPDLVGAVTYVEPVDGEYGRLQFSLSETWSSFEGTAYVTIDYDLTDDGYALMGVAHTDFYWDTETSGTQCTYDWSIHTI